MIEMVILSCMPPIEGWIVLIVFAVLLVVFRLKPLKCPECGSIMYQYNNDKWYCGKCDKWWSAFSIRNAYRSKHMQKMWEEREKQIKDLENGNI